MFRLKNLQSKSVALAVLFTLVMIIQLVVIRVCLHRWSVNEKQERVIHTSQMKALQLSTDVALFLRGEKSKLNAIVAGTEELNTQFKILKEGGVISSTKEAISPVSRLTQITLNRSLETWEAYKKSLFTITTHEVWKDSTVMTTVTEVVSDSVTNEVTQPVTQKIIDPAVAKAHTVLAGQWLIFSGQFSALEKDIHEDAEANWSLLVFVIGASTFISIALLFIAVFIFRKKIVLPLKKIEKAAINREYVDQVEADEIGKVAGGLNHIIDQLNQASSFVQNIGEGNLETVYTQTDQSVEGNHLAASLVSMQTKLKTMNEEEQKRKWANEGVARFVDILRSSNDNIHVLGDSIIATLVQYTGSNQGSLYVLNDEDDQNKYLELISLYAFNTKKYEQQKLKLGEGLVGQAYLEKDTIYLSEIPEDYIRITSGLGEANPKAILVVPLKVDMNVYGLVELASFKPYLPHEISFVEKLGETLASTLASVKNNQRNRKLLEESKMAAEAMHAQEEEMRQNMEELTATQEEMSRKERDYLIRIAELEQKLKEPARGNDWAMAEQMQETLQIQLEALKITQAELSRKR